MIIKLVYYKGCMGLRLKKAYRDRLKKSIDDGRREHNLSIEMSDKYYDCEKREVQVDGEVYDAYFPEEHSAVRGLIYKSLVLGLW